MIDRNSIPLAEGSRWDGDAVVDADGDSVVIVEYNGKRFVELNDDDTARAYPESLLAVITAAGLNPYAEALEKLLDAILRERALNSEMDPMRFSNEIGADCIQDELDAANNLLGRT